MQDLVDRINQSIEKNVEIIARELNRYLDEDFQQRIDNYFSGLDSYLSNYRDNLGQAQQDIHLSFEAKKNLVDELNNLTSEANTQVNKVNNYLDLIKSLNHLHR